MSASVPFLYMRLTDIAKKFLYIDVLFCLIVKFLIADLGLPDAISFVSDVLLIAAVFCIVLDRKSIDLQRKKAFHSSAGIVVLAFLVWATFSALINFVSLPLYLWALRNTGRFLFFFVCCALVFSLEDWKKLMSFLSSFVVINAIYMAYQFFFLGTRQDNLNGFLGTYVGGNSALNTLFLVVTTWLMSNYFARKVKLIQVAIPIVAMLFASALNELKFYFVEFAIIFFGCALIAPERRKDIVRGAGIVIVGVCIVWLGLQALYLFYPGFENFFTIESLRDYLFSRSYNSNEEVMIGNVPVMNRLSSLVIIPQYFFHGIGDYLFGVGFGATETSSIPLFTSGFYLMYGETNYQGYSSAYLLLEVGFVGLLLYFSIFLSVVVFCLKKMKSHGDGSHGELYIFGAVLGFLAVILCFYNSALRIETSGYIYFAALAVPFMFHYVRQGEVNIVA